MSRLKIFYFLNGILKSRLTTSLGEVDVDEDEVGNFTVGGEALSFESWAKLTQTRLIY